MLITMWINRCNCDEKDLIKVTEENKRGTKQREITICGKCYTKIAKEDM